MEDSSSVLVSVIVPVYNAGRYLDRCISSITNQSHKNLEILLVDDGSTDDSPCICREWGEKDERVRVFHLTRSGVSAARNKGLQNATGKYVGFVDADDEIEPEMYETILGHMLYANAKMGVCTNVFLDEDKRILSQTTVREGVLNGGEIIMDFLGLQIPGGVCNKLFSTGMIHSQQIAFDEEITHNEDFLFAARCCLCAECCVLIDKPFYLYYKHEDSATHLKTDKFDEKKMTSVLAARKLFSYVGHENEALSREARRYYLLKVTEVLMELAEYPKEKGRETTQKSLRRELRSGMGLFLTDRKYTIKYKILALLAAYSFGGLRFVFRCKNKISEKRERVG